MPRLPFQVPNQQFLRPYPYPLIIQRVGQLIPLLLPAPQGRAVMLKTSLMVKTGIKPVIGLLVQKKIGAKGLRIFAHSLVMNVAASVMAGFALGATIAALESVPAVSAPALKRARIASLAVNAALLNAVEVVLVLAAGPPSPSGGERERE